MVTGYPQGDLSLESEMPSFPEGSVIGEPDYIFEMSEEYFIEGNNQMTIESLFFLRVDRRHGIKQLNLGQTTERQFIMHSLWLMLRALEHSKMQNHLTF